MYVYFSDGVTFREYGDEQAYVLLCFQERGIRHTCKSQYMSVRATATIGDMVARGSRWELLYDYKPSLEDLGREPCICAD